MNEALRAVEAKLNEWREENPLRKWRKAVGASGGTVSSLCNVSRNSVTNWEKGHCNPAPEQMVALAHTMKITQIELESRWSSWMRAKP